MESKNIRNIALLGHGNSGKTSLAESMLFVTGAGPVWPPGEIDRSLYAGVTVDGEDVLRLEAAARVSSLPTSRSWRAEGMAA